MSKSFLAKLSKKFGTELPARSTTDLSHVKKANTGKDIYNDDHSPHSVTTTIHKPVSTYTETLREYHILMEYKLLTKTPIAGIYCLPNGSNVYRWDGIVFIRKGYYRKAIYKFILQFNTEQPLETPPTVHFISSVYHPLIDNKSGELDLSQGEWNVAQYLGPSGGDGTTSLRSVRGESTGSSSNGTKSSRHHSNAFSSQYTTGWDSNKHNILTILSYVKKVFYDTKLWYEVQRKHTKTVLKGEAGTSNISKHATLSISTIAASKHAYLMWKSEPERYMTLCERSAQLSVERMYIPIDDFSLNFSVPQAVHDDVWQKVQRKADNTTDTSSYMSVFLPEQPLVVPQPASRQTSQRRTPSNSSKHSESNSANSSRHASGRFSMGSMMRGNDMSPATANSRLSLYNVVNDPSNITQSQISRDMRLNNTNDTSVGSNAIDDVNLSF